MPYSPAIRIQVIYPKEVKTLSQGDMCTPVFIVALFTVAKLQRQPKRPSMDGWITKMWCVDTNVLFILRTPDFSTMWDPRLVFGIGPGDEILNLESTFEFIWPDPSFSDGKTETRGLSGEMTSVPYVWAA